MQFSNEDRAWFESEVPDASGEVAPDASKLLSLFGVKIPLVTGFGPSDETTELPPSRVNLNVRGGVALMSLADFNEMQAWLEGADRMATEERDKAAIERDGWRLIAFMMAVAFASVLVWDVLR